VSAGSGTRLPRERWWPISRRALRYLAPYRKRMAVALLCVVVASALGLVPALALREIVEQLVKRHGSVASVGGVIAIAVGAILAASLFGIVQAYLTLSMSENVVAKLRSELFDHLLSQSVGYFTEQRGGAAISHILNDAGGIDNVIGPTLLSLISSAIMGLASLVLMVILDWRLALITLVLGPLVFVLLRLGARALYAARKRVQALFSDVTSFLHDTLSLSGQLLIKSFARAPVESERFHILNRSLRDAEIRAGMKSAWFGAAFSVLQAFGPAVLAFAGGYLVVHHDLSVGTLAAFAVVASRFAGSVQTTASALLTMLGSLALWERVFDVLDREPELREPDRPASLPRAEGAVTFDRVRFAYPSQERLAINDVSIDIPARTLTALVGHSGAGKTTLSYLLPRFYDPQAGRVLIDGHDVRELSFETLGASVGMVLQDTYLTHAPLRDNLRYGRPQASDDEILAAAELANLIEVIAALPEGLDTVVGERGHRLSGGEKQRVAIARAVLKDPPILIFDEATSHLDSISERLVQNAMRTLMGGRTSIVIAHRLSTVLEADQIVVLQRGSVVEVGSHEELRTSEGLYSRLFESQFEVHGA
jgi:ATP-binding cassette, subfamily B, bacterial